jgi:hypothetical protein
MFSRHIQELRRLVARFREGTLTMDEVLGGYILCFVIGPFFVIPGFALWFIDTENKVGDDERIYYVTVGFFILFFVLMMVLLSRSLPQKPSLSIQFYRVLGAAISAAFFSLICGMGYFIFWNAISGSGKSELVSGPIIQMRIDSGGRFYGKPYFVTFRYNGRDMEVTVPSQEYSTLNIGQTYYRDMRPGGLGYYYNWGSKWWK